MNCPDCNRDISKGLARQVKEKRQKPVVYCMGCGEKRIKEKK